MARRAIGTRPTAKATLTTTVIELSLLLVAFGPQIPPGGIDPYRSSRRITL
jgi:hypothetical protein